MMTSTDAGQDNPGPRRLLSGDSPESVNAEIRKLVREARKALGVTQEQLGDVTGTSRFIINRIENGTTELTLETARHIAEALHLPQLIDLIARRDDRVPAGNARDTAIKRMLNSPAPTRIRAVLADDVNLYRYLYDRVEDDSRLKCDAIEVVVPTVARGRELFGDRSVMYGRVEYQIKRLLDLKKSKFYRENSLRVYESDDVIASMLVVNAAGGTEAAVWPPMPVLHRQHEIAAGILPVGITAEPQAVAQMNSHIDGLIGDHETVKSNEALCLVDPKRAPAAAPIFTRYFTTGEDQEDDIDPAEGSAVALIMVVALCPRKRYGVARRVIAYRREQARKDRRRSLFSNTVEEIDIQRAHTAATGRPVNERRSTRTSLAATLETTGYLAEYDGVIPDSAFQFAAAREMAMFDLDIDPGRFVPIALPTELKLIDKSKAAIAPRLFVLELGSDQQEPELEKLQDVADVDMVGTLDLQEDDNLNDFLDDAKHNGFLGELLKRYDIASR